MVSGPFRSSPTPAATVLYTHNWNRRKRDFSSLSLSLSLSLPLPKIFCQDDDMTERQGTRWRGSNKNTISCFLAVLSFDFCSLVTHFHFSPFAQMRPAVVNRHHLSSLFCTRPLSPPSPTDTYCFDRFRSYLSLLTGSLLSLSLSKAKRELFFHSSDRGRKERELSQPPSD